MQTEEHVMIDAAPIGLVSPLAILVLNTSVETKVESWPRPTGQRPMWWIPEGGVISQLPWETPREHPE